MRDKFSTPIDVWYNVILYHGIGHIGIRDNVLGKLSCNQKLIYRISAYNFASTDSTKTEFSQKANQN